MDSFFSQAVCALVGCVLMEPRIGRFDKNGHPVPMPGHSVPLSALGGLILIFGFFACNGTKQVRKLPKYSSLLTLNQYHLGKYLQSRRRRSHRYSHCQYGSGYIRRWTGNPYFQQDRHCPRHWRQLQFSHYDEWILDR